MNKQIFAIPALILLGVLVGVGTVKFLQDDTVSKDVAVAHDQSDRQHQVSNYDTALADDLILLNNKIDEMADKIELLENSLSGEDTGQPHIMHDNSYSSATTVDTPITAQTRPLSAVSLVNAGVDEVSADEIVRRKNELELSKLELRDAASRGGYLGTRRYMDELQELIDQDVPIREELGDDVYDRYLYNNGQANRIRVASVMLSSAAEQAGMKAGDLIITYDEQRLFEYGELQRATTEGDREDYVSVTVERDGHEQILWVPRGPLGIRLTTTRVNPDY